jgi:hypothetical protein
MKCNTNKIVKHNPILQGAGSSMHGRKSSIDDQEVLLSTVLIPDILLATESMHRSSFHAPPPSKSRDEIFFKGGGRAITPPIIVSLITFTKVLFHDQIQ